MTEKMNKLIKDSSAARWTALVLIASTMFFAYIFVDILSPMKQMLETTLGWDSKVFGIVVGSEYFLNVFVFFLIFAGIILDKMGVRFTGILSASMMIVGAGIKLYGLSEYFNNGGIGYEFFNSFWTSFPASAKLASLGFMIFGCGTEMAGITVSRAIVKWFTGKELAMAMGIEMAIARLGVLAVFFMTPRLIEGADATIVRPVAICALLLCIGLITFIIYSFMDRKLDRQLGAVEEEKEDPFRISDIGKLITSRPFLIVAFLCVLYYSAIFPFQKYAVDMLQNRLGLDPKQASNIFMWFPVGAAILTPFLGRFLDTKGKGATMLILGAILMIVCHLIFAFAPLTQLVAFAAIVILGISFSLVPAALWPSVPKLVENRYLGSAYAVIFWIQNIGLWLFPIVIGWALDASNPGITPEKVAEGAVYDYTVPMLIFACLGVLAFILGLWLKAEDSKNHYGLELPNIEK
ncbi:MAG: MFS transporter [Culturomica sp.]|jgi:predicted MFS family arabinose efflux permease|nr:MFS transporter [Culturomica sp.]